jgi:hypothetical protein
MAAKKKSKAADREKAKKAEAKRKAAEKKARAKKKAADAREEKRARAGAAKAARSSRHTCVRLKDGYLIRRGDRRLAASSDVDREAGTVDRPGDHTRTLCD